MPRIQALRQAKYIQRSDDPLTEGSFGGGAPHTPHLMNSGPVMKAVNLMKGLRIKQYKLPKTKLSAPLKSLRSFKTM